MNDERIFGFRRRDLVWMSTAIMLSIVVLRHVAFQTSDFASLADKLTQYLPKGASSSGEHAVLKCRIEPASGLSLKGSECEDFIALASARIRYSGHRDIDFIKTAQDSFTVDVLPAASLSKERVIQRLRMPGRFRIIPLASTTIPRELQGAKDAEHTPIRVAPGCLSDWAINEGGLIVQRDDRGAVTYVDGYDSQELLSNRDFRFVGVRASTFTTLTEVVFTLTEAGVAARNKYPAIYRWVQPGGPLNANSALVVDGWLISSAGFEGMGWPDHVSFTLPVPLPEGEDAAAAMAFPWPEHAVMLIESAP